MKILALIFIIPTILFSKVYYSKVEPYEVRNLSSSVSGVVEYINEDMIGKKLTSKVYIRIDSKLDEEELKSTKEKLIYLEETVEVNLRILGNMKESLQRKRDNYKKIENLKIKSRVEKDREFYDLVNSENSYLATQKEINTLKTQIADLRLRKAQLERSISDKNLSDKGFILYSIDVKVGQVVGMSTPLAQIADTSRAKLTIFLDEVDVVDAKSKVVYIDGKKTDYKVSRVLNIADSKNISKYMAQIIIKSPKLFSKLAKIELKDK
ncbi:MAG: HlyD family efflux transporter periplasmic adaptor subunit [Campylobacterota bacterium]|nr:HlyD family efflux transporter periplasmic adaptor subunit [Campylobacterota bacterium]